MDPALQPALITTLAAVAGSMVGGLASLRIEAARPDGSRAAVARFTASPDWGRRYWLEQPLVLPRGTRIEVTGASDDSRFMAVAFGLATSPAAASTAPVLCAVDICATGGRASNRSSSTDNGEIQRAQPSRDPERVGAHGSGASTASYDALGRITAETTALGSVVYSYDGATTRMASITYPNGQLTTSAYYDAILSKLSGYVLDPAVVEGAITDALAELRPSRETLETKRAALQSEIRKLEEGQVQHRLFARRARRCV
jgi:YD repeat-containing protein